MKKMIFLFLILQASYHLSSIYADDVCSTVDNSFINKHVTIRNFKIVSKKPQDNLCEVIIRIKGRLIPLYTGKNYIISGNLYSNKEKLTQAAIDKIYQDKFFENLALIKDAVAFIYTPDKKNGKEI